MVGGQNLTGVHDGGKEKGGEKVMKEDGEEEEALPVYRA